MVSVILDGLILGLHYPVTTVQTLTPKDINSTRWQRPYPRCVGLTFVQQEEWQHVVHLSYTVCGKITIKYT